MRIGDGNRIPYMSGGARSGQALAEYALLATLTIVALVGVPEMMLRALGDHYLEIATLLCLPIP